MEFLRSRRPSLSLDMAPLIDIVFLLLIFFMLTSSFFSPSIKLSLPQAVTQDPESQEKLTVSIDREGKFYFENQIVSPERLRQVIESKIREGISPAVHVRGDQDMPYKYFVEAMDTARQAGAQRIHVAHESASR